MGNLFNGKIIYRWVKTYENTIFSGMNIHLPAILGFTRYQGFDLSPSIDGFSIATFGYRSLFFHVCKLANETSILKLLMLENVLKLVSVVLQRARNNLYGWGCPLYCSQPSLSTLLLTFLLGLLLGLFLASFGLWALWTYLSSSPVQPAPPSPGRHPGPHPDRY